MNGLDVASCEKTLEQEVAELRARIDELRLGRRVLMNLLTLFEQRHQTQLQELKKTISALKRRNAELKLMLQKQRQS
ncbi:MAG: hypothetical protein ACOYEO_01185 [bacterium]